MIRGRPSKAPHRRAVGPHRNGRADPQRGPKLDRQPATGGAREPGPSIVCMCVCVYVYIYIYIYTYICIYTSHTHTSA